MSGEGEGEWGLGRKKGKEQSREGCEGDQQHGEVQGRGHIGLSTDPLCHRPDSVTVRMDLAREP